MRNFLVAAALVPATLASALCPAPAIADAPDAIVFEPTEPWALDYADDSCKLTRMFAAGPDKLVLHLRQYAPGEAVEIAVAKTDGLGKSGIDYRFGTAGDFKPVESHGVRWGDLDGWMFGASLTDISGERRDQSLPPWTSDERKAALSDAAAISFRLSSGEILDIQTGSLVPAFDAMSACLEELTTHWDIDHEAHIALSRKANPRIPTRYAMRVQEHYPLSALRAGQSAWVAARIDVDAQGNGTACHIQNGSAETVFAKSICTAASGDGLFEPALDEAGKPVSSYYTLQVSFMIPE